MTADTTQGASLAPCGDCGMPCAPKEYHPYAACLMFKACHNSETVRENLDAVRGAAPAPHEPSAEELWDICDDKWCQRFNDGQGQQTLAVTDVAAFAHAVLARWGARP